jgi:hypothetical protein
VKLSATTPTVQIREFPRAAFGAGSYSTSSISPLGPHRLFQSQASKASDLRSAVAHWGAGRGCGDWAIAPLLERAIDGFAGVSFWRFGGLWCNGWWDGVMAGT